MRNTETERQLQHADPRARLYPSAKVTLVENPAQEQACDLTQISLTTIELLADERLPVNELICVELADHLLLGDVKECVRRGSKFSSHAARIVTIRKTEQPTASNAQKIEALMADFHLQCKLRLSTIEASMADLEARATHDPATVSPDPGTNASRAASLNSSRIAEEPSVDEKVEREKADLEKNDESGPHAASNDSPSNAIWRKLPPPLPAQYLASVAITAESAPNLRSADFNWPPPPVVVTIVGAEPQPVKVEYANLVEAAGSAIARAPAQSMTMDGPANAAIEATKTEDAKIEDTKISVARDEDVVARAIAAPISSNTAETAPVFAAAAVRTSARRPWAISVAMAACVAILVWGISLFGRAPENSHPAPAASQSVKNAAEKPASPVLDKFATTGTLRPAENAAIFEKPSAFGKPNPHDKAVPATNPAAVAESAAKPLSTGNTAGKPAFDNPSTSEPKVALVSHASIKANGASWIAACSDGRQLFQNVFVAGDTREIEFSNEAVVMMGNARAVEIQVNGAPIQPVGVAGIVRAVDLTPAGARFMPINYTAAAHACGKGTLTAAIRH